MSCPACGTPTVPDARFCFACGTALPGSAVTGTGRDVEAERRVVTVLFGDLSDFTSWSEDLDPERVGGVTDRVLETLTAAVGEYGGHVDKLTGDGLMAVFGAPTAHEDDAERAVRAAARMQSAVRRVVEEEGGGGRSLGLRVGLNTGEVLAGVQAHLSYTVVGDTVNTAARLSDAAGVGAVLAGRDTALATMAAASWRALPPVRLKGKRDPVPSYELVGLRPPGLSRLGVGDEAPFLGREAELGLLVGRLMDVSERQTVRSVLVVGDAGIGKTRLVQELARLAGELPAARVLWGRCPPYGEGRDLAAVAEMVRTACGISESDTTTRTDDGDAAWARLERTVARLVHPGTGAPLPRAVGERLGTLLGLDEGVGAAPRESPTPVAAAGTEKIRAAVGQLFTALAAEGPLLLVVDDLHQATPAMLDGLLEVTGQTRGPVLLTLVGRPELLGTSPDVAWWRALAEVEVLPLLPLEESSAERLLRAYLGAPDDALDDAVRTALLSRAQGNPFFLAELLHLLIDRGVLRREAERWVLTGALPEGLLPAGVHAVLAARIDGLDGAAKGVLRDASVLGTRFSLDALEAVGRASGHGEPEVVRRAVQVLVERRLLEPDTELPATEPPATGPPATEPLDGQPRLADGAYRFGHTLVRDVAYAGLVKAERARRHAAAAAHAQATTSLLTAGRPVSGQTAADLVAASQGERAVRLAVEMGLAPADPAWRARGIAFAALARLGGAALDRDDHAAAQELLSRALSLDVAGAGDRVPADLVVPARVAHARALSALHRLPEAEAELVPALAAAEDGVRAGALVVLGDVRRRRGDVAGATQAFVSALAAAGSAGIDRVTGEALRQLGLVDYFDGRLLSAEDRFREAHALAARVDDPHGAGWALQHLAWSATTRGDYDLADATLVQAAEVFRALEDSGGLSWVAGTEGFVRLFQGRFAEARALAAALLPLGEATGERWGVAALLTIDAVAAAETGDIAAATAQAERARAHFTGLGDGWGLSLARFAAGIALRGGGQPDRAVEVLGEAVRLSDEGGHPMTGSLALVAMGYAHLDRGDLDGAQQAVERASALVTGLDLEPHALLGAKVLFAQVLRARGQLEQALTELDVALATGDSPALLFPRRQALAHRAGTLLELGRHDEALATARRAVELPTEDVRARVLALRALGSALRTCGEERAARRALREALEVARSTGQRSEVATTERLLAG